MSFLRQMEKVENLLLVASSDSNARWHIDRLRNLLLFFSSVVKYSSHVAEDGHASF